MFTDLNYLQLMIAITALFLGGFSKGVTGIGLPMIITPSLAYIYGIQVAVPVVAISTVTTNILVIGKYRRVWREVLLIWPMLISGLATTVLGVFALRYSDPRILAITLAVMAIGYVILNFSGNQIRIPSHRLKVFAPVMGGLAGFFQGTTGVCGPLVVAYLSGFKDFSREAYFYALSLVFLLFSMNQVSGYFVSGIYSSEIAWMGVLLSLPVICSFYIGIRLQERLDIEKVRFVTLLIILTSGINLLVANV